MRLSYNAPVTLSFSILAALVFLANYLLGGAINTYFTSPSSLHSPADYFKLISHIAGHASWKHLVNNFLIILMLGPLLEEKYGSALILFMIATTAALTAVISMFLLHNVILGASGIVFMFMVLSSLVNREYDEVPLTFVIVILFYLSSEIAAALLVNDGIAHSAHLIGGGIGGLFGFLFAGERR